MVPYWKLCIAALQEPVSWMDMEDPIHTVEVAKTAMMAITEGDWLMFGADPPGQFRGTGIGQVTAVDRDVEALA